MNFRSEFQWNLPSENPCFWIQINHLLHWKRFPNFLFSLNSFEGKKKMARFSKSLLLINERPSMVGLNWDRPQSLCRVDKVTRGERNTKVICVKPRLLNAILRLYWTLPYLADTFQKSRYFDTNPYKFSWICSNFYKIVQILLFLFPVRMITQKLKVQCNNKQKHVS